MSKTLDSVGIIGVSLLIAFLILGQYISPAFAKTALTDPVPGGMCRCMSCNCLMEEVEEAEEVEDLSFLESILSSQQLAAVLLAKTDEPKATAPKTTTTAPKSTEPKATAPKTTTTAPKTTEPKATAPKNPTTAPKSTEPKTTAPKTTTTAPKSTEPKSTAPTASTIEQDKSSDKSNSKSTAPKSTIESDKSSDKSDSSKNDSNAVKNTSGPKNSATGKVNGNYPYNSPTKSNDKGTTNNIRAQFFGDDSETALEALKRFDRRMDNSSPGLRRPFVEEGSLDPRIFGTPTKFDNWPEDRLKPDPSGFTTNPAGPGLPSPNRPKFHTHTNGFGEIQIVDSQTNRVVPKDKIEDYINGTFTP